MALSLFVISTALEFFGLAQKVFTRLKEREESGQAALAALDAAPLPRSRHAHAARLLYAQQRASHRF
jgi:hypothetical protein